MSPYEIYNMTPAAKLSMCPNTRSDITPKYTTSNPPTTAVDPDARVIKTAVTGNVPLEEEEEEDL